MGTRPKSAATVTISSKLWAQSWEEGGLRPGEGRHEGS